MTLKISFETDVKGFERVEKALQLQQKLLDQNAAAAERLNKAGSGKIGEAFEVKGMANIKKTEKQIQDLTGALSNLTKNQASLKSFMSLFSEFGKEVNSLKTEAISNVFSGIGDQISVLKDSMKGTSSLIGTLKNEIAQAKAEGNSKEAEEKTKTVNELSVKQMAESEMLGGLQRTQFMNAPRGILAGGSIAGTMAMGSVVAGGTMAVLAGASRASHFMEGGDRGDVSLFQYRQRLEEQGMAGSIGRQSLISRGVGQEARYFNRTRDNMGLEGYADLGRDTASWVMGGFSLWGKTREEIAADSLSRKAGLDAVKTMGIDKAGQKFKALYQSQDFTDANLTMGNEDIESFLVRSGRGGVKSDRATRALRQMAESGVGEEFANIMAGGATGTALGLMNTDQVAGAERSQMAARSAAELINNPAYIAMTEKAQKEALNQISRRIARGESGAEATISTREDIDRSRRLMGGGDTMNALTARMFTDYGSEMQGQSALPSTLAEVTQAAQTAMVGASSGGLTQSQAMTAATSAAGILNQQNGSAGTAMSQGKEFALIRLGITNPIRRGQILDMLSKGQGDKAVSGIAAITGKSPEEIRAALDLVTEQTNKMRRQVLGIDTPEERERDEKFNTATGGTSTLGYAVTGTTSGELASMAGGKAIESSRDFNTKGQDLGVTAPDVDIKRTEGQKLTEAEAAFDTTLIEANKNMMKTLGKDVTSVIAESFAKASDTITKSLTEGGFIGPAMERVHINPIPSVDKTPNGKK